MSTWQETVLGFARDSRCSDLHLQTGQPLALRVLGEIQQQPDVFVHEQWLDAFEAEYLTPTLQARYEKFGDVDFSFSVQGHRFRANLARAEGGRFLALRKLSDDIPSAESLGLPAALLAANGLTQGLVLVTGATGSGKSTTLAALLARMNQTRRAHILTLEDPIEYLHASAQSIVHQREIGRDAESFAQGLRAALREDPDVILLGEMRDLESISLALTAAETGHLVLATLHTQGAASTIHRLVDVFPAAQQPQIRAQLAQTLSLVVTQELLLRADASGRVAAFEVLVANAAVRNLIRENQIHQIDSVIQTSRAEGMQTLEAARETLRASGVIESA
jgi:twitching motility protein PilT